MANHAAHVRVQPIEWTDETPPRILQWASGVFEVVCEDCDDGGPWEREPENVRRLRGPYTDRATAKRAVIAHLQERRGTPPGIDWQRP